jgi:4-amino-4-deoxy-L-arabinose transferase-like glycosyltransferase
MTGETTAAEGGALRTVRGVVARAGERIDSRHTVALAALAAFLLRLPGLTRPVRADEAGFLLVARAWQPRPDSMFGTYWVDRPPLLIAVFRGLDALGGVTAVRVAGALACAGLVVLAAQVARVVADRATARWTAVGIAALGANPLIDVVAVKGELLGVPFVMGGILLSLLAARRRSALLALLAGLASATALGFKQNLAGALVFGGVLLVASAADGRLHRRHLVRLGSAALAGAAVPVLATVAWALAAGVRLHTLWYAVYGFRSDAAAVIAAGSQHGPALRAGVLLAAAVGAGLLAIIGGFLVHLRREWDEDRPLIAATLVMVVVDAVSLVVGASYWRDYLFPLLPAAALSAAVLARRRGRRGLAMRGILLVSAVSCLACLAVWSVINVGGLQEFDEADTGTALAAATAPGDTLVVFGGRADLQLTSGAPSPYPFLWSLPMRTLDPDLTRLRRLVAGPDAPTWIVEWVRFGTWQREAGAALAREVRGGYVEHGTGCGGHPIWLRRGLDRPPVAPECHGPAR